MRLIPALVTISCGLASEIARVETGSAADEDGCRITRKASRFDPDAAQVFARVVVARAPAREQLSVDWIDPAGNLVERAVYSDLPAGRSVCLLSAMQIAGFPAAAQPGRWRVEARLGGRTAVDAAFEILERHPGARIQAVTAERSGQGLRIDITGIGFGGDSTVHVAQFSSAGGWRYVAAEAPRDITSERVRVHTAALAPGEYVIVIRSPDGATSAPARLLVSGGEAYRFPAPDPQRWVVTQRPYGAFSHWNRSRHAWDIAPVGDRLVVAMRSGTVRASDLGMKQTPWKRSFGNSITIDHGDGEFSHYAHLKAGSFLVRSGQRVEQGQPLALAGNSGYALGPGGGVHLHVHVTRSPSIAAQSIPFEFGQPRSIAPPGAGSGMDGMVEVAQWWSSVVPVPQRTPSLHVRLDWQNQDADLDLHLVSPKGKHYGWYGNSVGYSGAQAKPEEYRIVKPEPGQWRVSVQGRSGGPGPIPFKVMARTE